MPRASARIAYGLAIALAIAAGAVALRAVLNPLIGTQFASAPLLVAALVVTWYLGTPSAILIALLGYPGVRFFVREEPVVEELPEDLTRWLVYAILIALIIGLTRRFRIEHDALLDGCRPGNRSEERLCQQANFDALTGIANRPLFFDRLNIALEQVTRHGDTLAILFIDIDGFTDVNDTYGRLAGDQLLAQIAGALTQSLRAEDTVARLGGDEFAILVPRLAKSRDETYLATKVLTAIAQPFPIEGGELTVSAGVGVALSSDSGNDSALLVKFADMALFSAKKQGKDRFHVFTRGMLAERERYLLDSFRRHHPQVRAVRHVNDGAADRGITRW